MAEVDADAWHARAVVVVASLWLFALRCSSEACCVERVPTREPPEVFLCRLLACLAVAEDILVRLAAQDAVAKWQSSLVYPLPNNW